MHYCFLPQLRGALTKNAVRVIELFRDWDDDGSGTITKKEFVKAMAAQHEWERSIGARSAGQLTVPWLMRAVHGTNTVRLLAILREPARRLHSAYYFWPQYRRRYGFDGAGFVRYVQATLPMLQDCFSAHGAHVCARSFEGIDQKYENVFYHADQFLKGAYSLYLVDWLRAFGRHRLLILRAEDYWADTQHTLKAVFAFLGVRPLSLNELQVIAAHPVTYLPGSNATFAADSASRACR